MLFIFGLAALLGFTALTIDVGLAWVARRDMQNTADAAALAGGDVLLEGGLVSQAKVAALQMAQSNGYDNADPDVTVTVNIPPASGPYVGDPEHVEVIIEHPVDAIMSRALGKTSWKMSARAISEIDRTPKPYAIIALSETSCKTTEFNGNIYVKINDAGTFTNSECFPDAFYTEGSVDVVADNHDVVGGWVVGGNVEPLPSSAGHYGDPLAGVPEPTPTSGPIQTCPTFSGKVKIAVLDPGVYDCTIDPPGQWAVQFNPGDYHITGGILVDGGSDVVFGAGLYYLGGVGAIITGNGTISGDGVTFYIDEGQVVLTGTGDVDLSAPKIGTYAGILIFQNRSLTTTVDLSGNAVSDGWGAIYALSADIHLVGNSSSTLYQFISDTFSMDGNSDVTINFDAGFLLPVPVVRLVE